MFYLVKDNSRYQNMSGLEKSQQKLATLLFSICHSKAVGSVLILTILSFESRSVVLMLAAISHFNKLKTNSRFENL